MTTLPVLWVSRHDEILARGYADQGMLEAALDRSLWRPPGAFVFDHREVRGDFPDVDGALVVINARTHASAVDVEWFRAQVDRLAWSVVLLCGDEEWSFPWWEIVQTDRRRVWAMQARPEHVHLSGKLPGGWYPRTHDLLAEASPTDVELRPLDWFFGGQVTHARRQECAAVLRTLPCGRLVETEGYLQEAVPRAEYFALMASARVVPCPSGPYSVDCARAFEALEAGCIPVVDTVPAIGFAFDYWALLFGDDCPLPRIDDWSTFPDVLAGLLDGWTPRANAIFAWWQRWKRGLVYRLDADLHAVRGSRASLEGPNDQVTAIVTTSPVTSHPSTTDVETTIDSIRAQLPDAEIVVAIDGVRPEQEHLRARYDEYVRRLLWLTNYRWHNVVPVLLPGWGHQANATRAALELVTTPLVLFVEHDTPLVGEIPWGQACASVLSGELNVVRFHHEAEVLPVHEYLMLDRTPTLTDFGLPVRRTVAWWQRPHLASTHFYRETVMPRFPTESRTMIEDLLYGELQREWTDRGEAAWWDWRVAIYAPEGGMLRSLHLNSRGAEPKYAMDFG